MVLIKTLSEKGRQEYSFTSSFELSAHQINCLIPFFSMPIESVNSALGGRTSVTRADIEGIGPIVIKHYVRGGFLRHVVKRTYLGLGKTRGQVEYEMLNKVRQIGVYAPEPIAYASKGRLFYKAWLITRQIGQHTSLATLSLTDEKCSQSKMSCIIDEVSVLIRNTILHVDLHPGNTLVDKAGRVYLVDFDKARFFLGNTNRLCHRYIRRWNRAVAKHCLPEMLSKEFSAGLARRFDLG
ncbi:MAG: phosphotransferase [Deltaproteobacteria bacterium]|nr:phosphotransferase [Deltaproteobacteria bacterium]